MKDSVRLGRVGGIPIGLNWSLAAFAIILAAGLADNRFPSDAPGYAGAVYFIAGTITAIVLVVGVLAHELGHAFVARRAGHRVDGITLSWMGGITRIEGDAGRPRTEIVIAAAGPVVSLALGGLLWLGRSIAVSAGADQLLVAALGWLAVIQFALAVFNLLPASPLDGGRILHGSIWAVSGSRTWAGRISSWAGMTFGAFLAGTGLWVTLTRRDSLDGVLLAVVGGWLFAAARDEERAGAVHRVLDGVRLGDVMRPVGGAPGWITVRAFMERYVSQRPGYVWLLERWDGEGYDGVVTGEALSAVPVPNWDRVRPNDVAVPVDAAIGAPPTEETLDALARTGGGQVILVTEGGHTIGAVLPRDIEALVRSGHRPLPRGAPSRAATAAR